MGKKKREEESRVRDIETMRASVLVYACWYYRRGGEERKHDCIKEKKREKKMVRNSKEYRENEKWTTRMERKIKR